MSKLRSTRRLWIPVVLAATFTLAHAQEPAPPQPPAEAPAPAPQVSVRPVRPAPPDPLMRFYDTLTVTQGQIDRVYRQLENIASQAGEGFSAEALNAYKADVQNQLRESAQQVSALQDRLRTVLQDLPNRPVSRLIRVQHVSATQAAELLKNFGRGATITANDDMNVLAVTGPADAVGEIEEALATLDQADPGAAGPMDDRQNIELIVYLVRARATAPGVTAPAGADFLTTPLPERLNPVVQRLKTDFPYQEFALVNTLLLRGRDGQEIESSSILPSASPANDEFGPIQLKLQIDSLGVRKENPKLIGVNDLVFGLSLPTTAPMNPNQRNRMIERRDFGLRADLDVLEGHDTVAAKVDMGSPDSALFLIVNAKTVDPSAPPS